MLPMALKVIMFYYIYGDRKRCIYHLGGISKLQKPSNMESINFTNYECTKYQCISLRPPPIYENGVSPEPCPPIVCPSGYTPEFDQIFTEEFCPRYYKKNFLKYLIEILLFIYYLNFIYIQFMR